MPIVGLQVELEDGVPAETIYCFDLPPLYQVDRSALHRGPVEDSEVRCDKFGRSRPGLANHRVLQYPRHTCTRKVSCSFEESRQVTLYREFVCRRVLARTIGQASR